MVTSNVDLAKQLEEKITLLITKFESASARVEALEAENSQLKEQLKQLSEEKRIVEEQYSTFKMSSAISGDSEQTAEAKHRIAQIVREIDKCIALLNR